MHWSDCRRQKTVLPNRPDCNWRWLMADKVNSIQNQRKKSLKKKKNPLCHLSLDLAVIDNHNIYTLDINIKLKLYGMENKIKHHSPLGSLAFWISVFPFFSSVCANVYRWHVYRWNSWGSTLHQFSLFHFPLSLMRKIFLCCFLWQHRCDSCIILPTWTLNELFKCILFVGHLGYFHF